MGSDGGDSDVATLERAVVHASVDHERPGHRSSRNWNIVVVGRHYVAAVAAKAQEAEVKLDSSFAGNAIRSYRQKDAPQNATPADL